MQQAYNLYITALKHQRVTSVVLLLMWMGVIFYFSSLPQPVSHLEWSFELLLRKLAHFFEYFVLCFLVFWVSVGRMRSRYALVVSIVGACLYAISDEYHQSFVPGRHATLMDIGIDLFGILTMGMLLYNDMLVTRARRVFSFLNY
ncbi:VanZ family protein [Candidatus Falkowbacteria bacterium]|nr:VanZ family protein [Candidatus Falkowbacteria bacterium]